MKKRIKKSNFLAAPLGVIIVILLLVFIYDHFSFISAKKNVLKINSQNETQQEKTREKESTVLYNVTSPNNLSANNYFNKLRKTTSNLRSSVKKSSKIRTIIQSEIKNLSSFNHDSKQEEVRLKTLATHFSLSELDELKDTALDVNQNFDKRKIAIYFLKIAGINAHFQMQEIALAPNPYLEFKPEAHSVELEKQIFEISLRTTALKVIDENLYQSKYTLKSFSKRNISVNNSYLQGLIRILLTGEKEKQPILTRYFQQALNEAAHD